MRFGSWYALLLIPVVIAVMFWNKRTMTIDYSSVALLKNAGLKKTYKHLVGKIVITIGLCLLVVALARPQLPTSLSPIQGEGIDIVMLLDVSGSMESVDFEPNRLEVARETIESFVTKRFEDRVGLVVFAGTAYTRIPLTLDHDALQQSLKEVGTSSVSEEGTAIGMAISVGVNRLKKSEARSKVMILVTDGDNNAGAINPDTASRLAKDMGIRIYTIGVGTDENIYPVSYFGKTTYQKAESTLDEPLLKSISEITDGAYYRALDEEGMEQIFDHIDELERTEFDRDRFQLYDEWAFGFISVGMIVIMIGMYLSKYRYIQVP